MSESIQSISQGTYTIGNTNELTFSAGPGIKVDSPSEGVVRIGNDETVLWNTITPQVTTTTAYNLNESFLNFEYIKIFYQNSFGAATAFMNSVEALIPDETSELEIPTVFPCGFYTATQYFDRNIFSFTSSDPAKVTVYAAGSRINVSTTGNTLGCNTTGNRGVRLLRIVGRNRKANA